MNPSEIIHFDITGPDEGALHAFYSVVLGWSVDVRGAGYALVDTGRLRGAISEESVPSVSIGVGVADLEAAVERVVAHGGAVVMPPTDNGWVTKATVLDPAGNLLTLIQS